MGQLATLLARRFLFLPLADGVGVAHYDFVHPGERLGEKHGALEEAQVASVQRQGEDDVGLLCCRESKGQKVIRHFVQSTYVNVQCR